MLSTLRICDSLPSFIQSQTKQILQTLEEKKQEIVSGQAKRELTHWYIHLIGTSTDKFLSDSGFIHSCVPYDYVDQAPDDMDAIHRNYTVICNILSPTSHMAADVTAFITTLKEKVSLAFCHFTSSSRPRSNCLFSVAIGV